MVNSLFGRSQRTLSCLVMQKKKQSNGARVIWLSGPDRLWKPDIYSDSVAMRLDYLLFRPPSPLVLFPGIVCC